MVPDSRLEALLQEQYEIYRNSHVRIAELSLRIIAVEVRREFPTATGVWLTASDQGPHMTLRSVVLDSDLEVGLGEANDPLEDRWQRVDDVLDHIAGNLGYDDVGTATWEALCVPEPAPQFDHSAKLIDVQRVLDTVV